MPEWKTRGAPSRLAPWIRRQRESARDAEERRLELVHEATQLVVSSWMHAELDDEGLVTKAVIESAQGDCDGRDVMTAYVLRFAADGETRGSTTLRMKPQSMDKPVTEAPDLAGMLAQQMRHNEGLVRLVVTNTDRMMSNFARLADTLTRRLELAEAERVRLEAELRGVDDDDDDGRPDVAEQILDVVGQLGRAQKVLGEGGDDDEAS